MLVIRGSMNGGCDPAIVTTTVADRGCGAGLPARVDISTMSYKLRGSSVILLRRIEALSGGHLGRHVKGLPASRVGGMGETLSMDFKLKRAVHWTEGG